MRPAIRVLPTIPTFSWDDCRLLVESVVDHAIFILDAEGRIATWNAGAQKLHGWRADEIVGASHGKLFLEEDVAARKPEQQLRRALEAGRAEDEGWRVRKDGTRFWAGTVVHVLRDEAGGVRGFGKVTRDLSARRSMEDDLRAAEERFHHLVDAVTDYAIFLLDDNGNVATWNPGARKIKGYEAREIVGRHFSAFYTPEDRAAHRPQAILDTVRREGRFEEEAWRVRKDGSRFWANVVITALRDEGGKVVGFAKVTRDLTAKRRAEEELRRSEERFRLLVESVSDYAIYMLDPAGRVTTWNAGAQRMKGYSPSEILGKSFTVFFPSSDVLAGKPARELEIAQETGRYEDEGWRCRKDGTTFWANVIVTAIRDADGVLVGFAKVTRDLTARREAEENERRLLEEKLARASAENATRAKDDFLATVSHELRTPLNALMGYASLLRARGAAHGDPALAKAIEAIHRNVQTQARIVDDILDVSRIVTGKLRLEVKSMDLVSVTKDAIEVVKRSAQAKGVAVELFVERDAMTLVGDPERLRQVVWNLLSNAVKFTDAGGTVTVCVEQEGSKAAVTVRDTGRGIDRDFLPHVFERFQQADSSTTRKFGGLGLGLAIVRHIVHLHGGSVSAQSEGRGKGATFKVILPVRAVVVQEPSESEEPTMASMRPALPSLEGVRVVVVDDDRDARELLHDALEGAGAQVETAPSVMEGIEAVKRARPHVLVSDIGMPDEDGYALMKRLRALAPTEGGGIPSIALTAYTRTEDRAKAIAAGFTSHLGKPVNPEELVAAVANLAALARR